MQVKTLDQIVTETLGKIGARTSLTNFNVGSVVRTLVETFSEVAAELFAFSSDMLKQAFMDTATGVWLDRHAGEFGLTRFPSAKAVGRVVLARNISGTTILAPAGTIVATPPDQSGTELRFRTTEDAVLTPEVQSLEVAVEADEAGSRYNVGSGTITRLKTFISGLEVSNGPYWLDTAGRDQETDAALRERCFLVWQEISTGSTAGAVASWARGVAGVRSAMVDDLEPRGPGTVDVYIVGPTGIPDPELVDEVQEVIDAKRPVTSDILVLPPVAVSVPVTLVVTPLPGHATEAMDTELRRRLGVYFGDIDDASLGLPVLGIGKDVVRARLVALAMAVPGVYAVDVTAPAANVAVAPNEFPELGAITIQMLEATDELV